MFEASGLWLSQQHSPLESSTFRSHMIASVDIRQHEVLPVSVNPYSASVNLGFNEFGVPRNSEFDPLINSVLYSPTPRGTPDGSPLEGISLFPQFGEKPLTYGMSCPRKRNFLVFDQSGNETRLMFNSLCPGVQNLPAKQTACPVWNPQVASTEKFDAFKFLPKSQARKSEQMCTKTPNLYEESGENKIFDEECEMREDTEEINALLYSEDYDDQDYDFNGKDDEEVSSGHSPLAKDGVWCKQEERLKSDLDDEMAISSIPLKRRKTNNDGYETLALTDTMMNEKPNIAFENIHSEDFSSAIDNGTGPNTGSKRPRRDKIRETLKVLESILPGLKSKDPILILDEAISYLKCLKDNAETMSEEDNGGSGCYEPLN